jgi:hypothetical protein
MMCTYFFYCLRLMSDLQILLEMRGIFSLGTRGGVKVTRQDKEETLSSIRYSERFVQEQGLGGETKPDSGTKR